MENTTDSSLPYFDYGLFKPGELAFKLIGDFLQDDPEPRAVRDASLRRRDGVPLFVSEPRDMPVQGVILRFKPESAEEAYRRIHEFVGHVQYRWDFLDFVAPETGEVEIRTNVLIGVDPSRGSDSSPLEYWTAREEPIFHDGMEAIRRVIEENKGRSHEYAVDWISLFNLQMAYLLLWSAIEQYCYLAYGLYHKPDHKRGMLASESPFQDALERVLKDGGEKVRRSVYRSDDITRDQRLNFQKPKFSLDYYYTVRSNIAHRGKEEFRDAEIVESSLIELYQVFQQLLERTLFAG